MSPSARHFVTFVDGVEQGIRAGKESRGSSGAYRTRAGGVSGRYRRVARGRRRSRTPWQPPAAGRLICRATGSALSAVRNHSVADHPHPADGDRCRQSARGSPSCAGNGSMRGLHAARPYPTCYATVNVAVAVGSLRVGASSAGCGLRRRDQARLCWHRHGEPRGVAWKRRPPERWGIGGHR
jgi:hypothetical protein